MNAICKTIFICLVLSENTFCQNCKVFGYVTDSNGNSLENAMVSLFTKPLSNKSPEYTTLSNKKGRYEIFLDQKKRYNIVISFIGFRNDTTEIVSSFDSIQINYSLTVSEIELHDVTITETIVPMKISEDTVRYNVQSFTNGEERKLREILSKLPGIEVDEKGNVTAQGKKINKLMVDGKTFFYGDTKLGVNNIPADVVANVEVISNYSEITYLKGFNDDNTTALNISLKNKRKKFYFGDIEVGLGWNDRYKVHPNLFYYSPKLAINSISDFNNFGQTSFTFEDYLNYEGGVFKLLSKPNFFKDNSQSLFFKNLFDADFEFKKTAFGSVNLIFTPSTGTAVSFYSINNSEIITSHNLSSLALLANGNVVFQEMKNANSNSDNLISLNKLTVNQYLSSHENINYEFSFKIANPTIDRNVDYSSLSTNYFKTNENNLNSTLSQNLEYSKRFSTKNSIVANLLFDINSNHGVQNWESRTPLFFNFFSNGTDSMKNLGQTINNNSIKSTFSVKDEIILDNFNHLYLFTGVNISNQNFYSLSYEQNGNQDYDLKNLGFDNNTLLNLNDYYVGFTFKSKIKKMILKLGVAKHYFQSNLSTNLAEKRIIDNTKLLPNIGFEYKISTSQNLKFNYQFNSLFQDVSKYLNSFILTAFNTVYIGNDNLKNDLISDLSLNYFNLNLFRGFQFDANAFSFYKTAYTQEAVDIIGVNRVTTPFFSNFPEKNFNLRISLSKIVSGLKLSLNASVNVSEFSKTINKISSINISNKYTWGFKMESNFKHNINFSLAFNNSFNNIDADAQKQNFVTYSSNFSMKYKIFKQLSVKFTYYNNLFSNASNNQNNVYSNLNFLIEYEKSNSPLRFSFILNNLFNTTSKEEGSINQNEITYSKLSIQPRVVIFSISYKL